MPLQDPAYWTDLLRKTFSQYREPLLRQVAARLVKPRGQWPVEELIERCVAFTGNPVQIDRRLKELPATGRQVLSLIAHSRQPRWCLGNLLEMLVALGHPAEVQPILDLLDAGLLCPVLTPVCPNIGRFVEWLARGGGADPTVFAHPALAARARTEELPLPILPSVAVTAGPMREADGLEWPLRMTALWQQVAAVALRRTQSGDFFKRDLDRLRQDPLLSAAPADSLAEVPDAAFLAVALAEIEGILQQDESDLCAAVLPAWWDAGLPTALESHFAALFMLVNWNPLEGGCFTVETRATPFPSAYLLLLLLLKRQPAQAWCSVADLEAWLLAHHPFWTGEGVRPSRRQPWVAAFLLGLAYDLRLVQAARDAGNFWAVRLSPLGRWLLGDGDQPRLQPAHAQTLLVQPNLEIVAYRQGLTPGLIARLGKFAAWKQIGAACTLQLEPGTVYRALEQGLSFESIKQTLEQYGARALPASVVDSLRTWADKRDRISVYASACLLEFLSADDLNEAVARGLPAVRLNDRLALVTDEDAIDFRHFRLTGTRDYSLPPDRCVTVEPDGVSLTVDLTRSDLLLETELPRFAELLPSAAPSHPAVGGEGRVKGAGQRHYRLTPASLAAGRDSGLTPAALDEWFHQRAGQFLPPAARLLLTGSQEAPSALKQHWVLHVASEEMADGLMQWPQTRALIGEQLGPTALAVAEENRAALLQKLSELGIILADNEP
jgi:hypothetical protein